MCHYGIEDHFFTMYADDGRIVYGKAENSTDGQDPSTLFKIAITESGGIFTADKTFAEAKAALDEGNVVVAEWTNLKLRGQLTGYADDLLEFTFHSFMGTDEYLILQNDNTVTHLVSEVGEEKIPSRVIVKKTDASLQVTATVDGVDQVTTIALNEDGDPVSVTKDGKTTTLTWEGFE